MTPGAQNAGKPWNAWYQQDRIAAIEHGGKQSSKESAMPDHVVLIPFDTKHSSEHIQSTLGGIQAEIAERCVKESVERKVASGLDQQVGYMAKSVAVMPGWHKIKADRVVCKDSQTLTTVLASLDDYDTLYIRGHCAAGSSVLLSSDQEQPADVAAIISILSGRLPLAFSGLVKVYACESACASKSSSSFAQKLSDAMIGAGWRRCRYYGYKQAVSTFEVNGHKRFKDDHTKRASESRIEINKRPGMVLHV